MDPDDNEPVEEGKVVSERMHARFSHAVSELQFLGFIKPSKRKTDHVERLTF
jgi:origin recognition complex subunit 3